MLWLSVELHRLPLGFFISIVLSRFIIITIALSCVSLDPLIVSPAFPSMFSLESSRIVFSFDRLVKVSIPSYVLYKYHCNAIDRNSPLSGLFLEENFHIKLRCILELQCFDRLSIFGSCHLVFISVRFVLCIIL